MYEGEGVSREVKRKQIIYKRSNLYSILESDNILWSIIRLGREIVGMRVEDMLTFYLFFYFWMFQWLY